MPLNGRRLFSSCFSYFTITRVHCGATRTGLRAQCEWMPLVTLINSLKLNVIVRDSLFQFNSLPQPQMSLFISKVQKFKCVFLLLFCIGFAGSSGDELDLSKDSNRSTSLVPPVSHITPWSPPSYADRLKVIFHSLELGDIFWPGRNL